jgi:hypothetical protein
MEISGEEPNNSDCVLRRERKAVIKELEESRYVLGEATASVNDMLDSCYHRA